MTLRLLIGLSVLLAGMPLLNAQTNPTPFDLSTGNYSFTTWNSSQAAGTFPPSMVFHTLPILDAQADQASNGDWLCPYSNTAATRIRGEGANGISFVNTGSTPTNGCNCSFVGAAVLALNTTGRANVKVSFVSQRLGSAQPRVYAIRLQYRLGSSAAWTNALTNDGAFVEYLSTTGTAQTIATTLPTSLENQPLVQLRWVYAHIPVALTGARPQLRLDDISVTSTSILTGAPTALAVTSVTPTSPSRNIPFGILIRSVDGTGAPKNVTAATTVTVSLNTGTGALSGTLTGTIPAGSSYVAFSNVSYNTSEAGVSVHAAATAGMALTAVNSAAFTVQDGATYAAVTGFVNAAYVNTPMNPFKVTAWRANNTIDANYTANVTITKVSGPGNVTLTSTVAPFLGVATFDNISVDQTGTYVLRVDAPGLPSITLPALTVAATPQLVTNTVPQYIHSRTASGACNSSVGAFPIPVFASVTFTNLQPGTVYRYNTGLGTDHLLTSTGGGFNLHYNGNTNTYSYLNGKSLNNDGEYSVFSTKAGETSKTIWVNLIASTNDAFQEGNTIYWRISLGDQLGRLINRYELAQSSQVIRLGSASNQATGIVDVQSQLAPKNYVFLYDNTAGTGRPLSIALVQDDGATITGAETFYRNIDNVHTAWATFIPNNSAVRRIEERDYRDNSIVYAVTSDDGIWNGVSTVNATGGFNNPIFLETPKIVLTQPMAGDSLCALSSKTIAFTARGMNNVRIEFSRSNGLSYELVDVVPASQGTYTWTVPGIEFSPDCRIRITGVERPDISAVSGRFVVIAPLSISQQPESRNMCLGDDHTLIVLTSGSVRYYQWYKDGQPLANSNTPIFSIQDVQYLSSGRYWCKVVGFATCGDVVSDTADIRVVRPTTIINQSLAVPAQIGANALLTVEGEAPNEFSYQWYRGDLALSDDGHFFGTMSSRLEIRDVRQQDIGTDYYCVVTGTCGTATSRKIRIFTTGVYAEAIASTVAACIGQSVNVDALAYANPVGAALDIRWYRNGQPLSEGVKYSGTRTQHLQIFNVTTADAGMYEIRAALADAPVQYASAMIDVVISGVPVITQGPANTTICEGDQLTLNVEATVPAQGGAEYQWSMNGTPLPNATSKTLTIDNMTAARAGSYTVTVSTPCGLATSENAVVVVNAPHSFTQQPPATLSVNAGESLTITVAVTGTGTPQYQWFKDGTAITGEVAPTYMKASVTTSDAGRYWCRVLGDCGEKFSDTTTVTILPAVSVDEDVLAGGTIVGTLVPNPVGTSAILPIDLPTQGHVTVRLVDMAGQVVSTIADAMMLPGKHALTIDASRFPSGAYLLDITIGGDRTVRTVSIIK